MDYPLILAMAMLAFANGANDNSKGVAALVGYGVAKPRQALVWAAASTALGAMLSCWLGAALLKSFGGGLFNTESALPIGFFTAALGGALAWLLIATAAGLPVSSTHALIGAMAGAGLPAFGLAGLNWQFLAQKFVLPLAASPLMSLVIVYVLARPLGSALGKLADRCACVSPEPVLSIASGAAAMEAARVSVVVRERADCPSWWPSITLSAQSVSQALHWISSGLIGFARGWNDAPKIAALGIAGLAGSQSTITAVGIVTIAMAIGGLLAGARVLETLAHKVTEMPLAESLSAGMTTATLVGMASWNGLPVSTTHVSTGAILGAGLRRDPRGVRWGMVREIVLSWLVTLPASALLAVLLRLLL